MDFNEQLGQRLRDARKRRGWSLLDVEEMTDGEFKASVMGAYERGERSVSALRLCRLADIYDTSAGSLLPAPHDGSAVAGVVIDLDSAETMTGVQADAMERFLDAIQTMRRGSDTGLAVRQSDLRLLNSFIQDMVSQPEAVFEAD